MTCAGGAGIGAGAAGDSVAGPGAEAVPALTNQQRSNLAARLAKTSVDRTDHGQVMPGTAAALALPDAAERVEAMAHALLSERLIVPIDVEADPRLTGHHSERAGNAETDWATVETPIGPALVAYSCTEQLQAARPGARPMPLKARTLALTALVETQGRICIDPSGAAVVLPRPATSALASGDRWLPAWKDAELEAELREIAAGYPVVAAVGVRRAESGGFALLIGVDPVAGADGGEPPTGDLQATVNRAIQALAASPRLIATTDPLEIRPYKV